MTALTRRAALAGAALVLPALARAQNAWPAGPIRLVAPFPAGGSVDAIARLVQPDLQRRLGATVLVENRPGASGSVGAAAVAKAAPDGQTWLFAFDTHAVNPALLPNLAFDSEKDLDPVLLIGTAPNLLATHPSRPFKTLADVIEAAKARPDALTYATIGAGSLGHLTMVLLAKRAGVSLAHVPYRGGGPAVNDAIGGHVDLIVGSAALLAGQVAGGALRPIVQTGERRHPALAAVPTVSESGLESFVSKAWWGVFAPAGTPAPIQERFRAELRAVLAEPGIAARLAEGQTMEQAQGGADELRAFFREQMTTWGAVVRENGIKADS